MTIENQLEQKAADMGYRLYLIDEVFRRKPPYPGYAFVCSLWREDDEECRAVFAFNSFAEAWKWLDKPESERIRLESEKRAEEEEYELAEKLAELDLLPIPGVTSASKRRMGD